MSYSSNLAYADDPMFDDGDGGDGGSRKFSLTVLCTACSTPPNDAVDFAIEGLRKMIKESFENSSGIYDRFATLQYHHDNGIAKMTINPGDPRETLVSELNNKILEP